MNNPPTFQHLGASRFMALPLELRLRVYHFAVIEPHPLPLTTYHFGRMADGGYGVEKDLWMLETCEEFHTEMSKLLYSENSFSYTIPRHEPEEDTESFKIDLRRVQKCYIPIEDMKELPVDSDTEEGVKCILEDEGFLEDFKLFVTTLAFKSHEMKYLLIECEPQDCVCLAEGLSPLFLLRNIGLVHFRSRHTAMHRYFRFLEGFMMSDWLVPFSDMDDFWEKEPDDPELLDCPEESWLVKDLDMVASVAVRPQEQLEITAKELYSTLGVEGNFIPESEWVYDV